MLNSQRQKRIAAQNELKEFKADIKLTLKVIAMLPVLWVIAVMLTV